MSTIILLTGGFIIYLGLYYYGQKNKRHRHYSNACPPPKILKSEIVFKGENYLIGEQDIHHILIKRYGYYKQLENGLQERFRKRLRNFMNKKIFIIKDDEGFREMPVLISAACIQLTFGLKHYKLPFYKYIRIYPDEYVSDHSFKILAGNVQGNTISIAWNHLLKGYADVTDGANLGLHEMSHALYFQKLVIEENFAHDFCRKYNCVITECHAAFKTEVDGTKNLYSDYATTDMQEFWAESVEIFFEKTNELKANYPQVFDAIMLALNQNPLNKTYPLVKTNLYLLRRLKDFKKVQEKVITKATCIK